MGILVDVVMRRVFKMEQKKAVISLALMRGDVNLNRNRIKRKDSYLKEGINKIDDSFLKFLKIPKKKIEKGNTFVVFGINDKREKKKMLCNAVTHQEAQSIGKKHFERKNDYTCSFVSSIESLPKGL